MRPPSPSSSSPPAAQAVNPRSRAAFLGLHALLLGSGALALVYEILWMRRFTAVFGASTPAVAATLAAVFFGFAAGSLIVGSRTRPFSRPWRVYAILEIVAGIGALLVEPLLGMYDRFYPQLYHAFAGSGAAFAVIKTLLAMGALFLPTCCMGATLPVLGDALGRSGRGLGISAGGLYAANTLGASLGAFSVPFLWFPNLSTVESYRLCVIGSIGIGVLAGLLDAWAHRGHTESSQDGAPATTAPPHATPPTRGRAQSLSFPALLCFAGLSGALLFMLQVIWSRMFAQVHENSVYSFSIVVAVVLVGLAAGAALTRQALHRNCSARRTLGLAWSITGFLVLLTPTVFHAMTGGLAYLESGRGWTAYGLQLLLLTVPTVLLPTTIAGMALPLLMEMAGGAAAGRSARWILGCILGANTAGSIAGSLAAAFVVPATLGLWGGLIAIALVLLLAGDRCLGPGTIRRAAIAAVSLAAILILNPLGLPRTRYRPDQGETLVSLRESSHGIIAVVEKPPSRRIKLNNFYVLGGTASTGDERLQTHLPLLMHPAPRRVAFLGLGTGITAGAALLHRSVEQVTAIELVPEVVPVARTLFAEANLGIVDAPGVRVFAEDARNHLLGSTDRFDVIVGDLFVPWHAGESALYTAEHFAAVRRSLERGGLFCQWIPLFQLSEAEFNIVAATFLDTFPNTTLWRGDFAPGEPALALMGWRDPDAVFRPDVVAERIRQMKPDPANPTLAHPAGAWMFLAGPLSPAEERFARARRNRESQPWLELLGPLSRAAATPGTPSTFVGRPLEDYLNTLRARPTQGTSLAQITDDIRQWRSAGAFVAEGAIRAQSGRAGEADRAMRDAARLLPAELRAAFGVGTDASPGKAQ